MTNADLCQRRLASSTRNCNYIWVYWDQLDADCLVLFYYTFFTLHVSDVIRIHPQERHIMHMQSDTGKCDNTLRIIIFFKRHCCILEFYIVLFLHSFLKNS